MPDQSPHPRVHGPLGRRRLPAEWERQSGVWLTWPRSHNPWGADSAGVMNVFLALARAILARESLLIVVEDEETAASLATELANARAPHARLHCVVAPADDVWARDHGPITVLTAQGPRLLDFRFNGWGNKYPAAQDDALPGRVFSEGVFGDTPRESVDWILEGGSIDCDGAGTLLTTARCLLSPARHPTLDRHGAEARLRSELGVHTVHWLQHGYLAGDDTDGHIDMLARFVAPGHITYTACPDQGDEHYAELALMADELATLRTDAGTPYRLTPLPWPRAKLNDDGERLPASYANFLIINDAVLVPTYDDPADKPALTTIAGCFPAHQVIGIPALPLIHQFGSLHCVTMQLPAGVLP